FMGIDKAFSSLRYDKPPTFGKIAS
ncbi:hypothetical protein LCGC14_2783530, partial [marine sediment metagenome]